MRCSDPAIQPTTGWSLLDPCTGYRRSGGLPVPPSRSPACGSRPYGGGMDRSAEIREFLRTRRARITPEQAGLAPYPGARRVPGLRRAEVAQLAGVSVDYYIRLERGRTRAVSESVLDAVARPLQLDDTERAHLFDLAQPAATRSRPRRTPTPQRVRPVGYHALDALSVPAIVQRRRMDALAPNRLPSTLFSAFQP